MDVGLDGPALDRLIKAAEASESDSLLLVKDGRIVVERSFGRRHGPIDTWSVTKSVASLAVLALIADGKIASLDVPLSTFFPEFARGDKAAVTLRHVLTHASGIAHGVKDAKRLNAQKDRLAFVRRLPVKTAPGTRFSYNNEASQLLAGVVKEASGVSFDKYVTKRIFEPIGVDEPGWARDRSGGIQTYYGLRLRARDLARIGLLLLHHGRVGERVVLPEHLVRQAAAPSATNLSYGLLFWRRSNLVQVDDVASRIPEGDLLAPFAGRVFRSEVEYFDIVTKELGVKQPKQLVEMHSTKSRVLRELPGEVGFYAVGGLGQRLAIYPSAGIVAVRQHRRRPGDDSRKSIVSWRSFYTDVEALDPKLARPRIGGPVSKD